MNKYLPPPDDELLRLVSQGDNDAFGVLFNRYYKDLVLFAGTIIREQQACEDIVQNIFLKFWNQQSTLTIQRSLKSYLLSAVRNSCIEVIRHRKVVSEHQQAMLREDLLTSCNTDHYALYSDLSEHLREALDKLPPKLRECFEMNRFQNLKYHEIAQALNVSVRTVEVRISQSIAFLREHLREFCCYLYLILLNNMW